MYDYEVDETSIRDEELEAEVCTVDIACYDDYSHKAQAFNVRELRLVIMTLNS